MESSVRFRPTHDASALSDDELVDRFRAGDKAAFATLYERYVDRIYDFVARLLHDREAAADVTQETFVKALTGLRARRVQGSVRSWLFTIARNAAIDYQRRQRTQAFSQLTRPEAEEDWEPDIPATGPEADPEEAARRAELAQIVWQAARTLSPTDYAVLELSLRHDLTPAEVAQVVGVRRGAINTRLSRVRDALEESVTVLLLARSGQRRCSELARLLAGVDLPSQLTPEVRRNVIRHLEQCDICQRERRKISAADLLPALVPLLPTPETRAALDAAVHHALAALPSSPVSPIAQARAWLTGTAAGKAALGTVAAVVVLVGAIGSWLAFGTTSVTVTTSDCPPLELRLTGPAATVAGLLGVPDRFLPGQPTHFRLPAGTIAVTVTSRTAQIRLAGVPVEIQLEVPLADVRWDGASLFERGPSSVTAARGSTHSLELVCRRL